jgi:hypothetical protein
MGGRNQDRIRSIVVDEEGNAYVGGQTMSSDFPTTFGVFDQYFNGYEDFFVGKLDADGSSLAYSTYLGGSDWDYGCFIAVDAGGNAYVTGRVWSRDFPTTPGAFSPHSHGGDEACLTILDAAGARLLYSTYLGGTEDDAGFDITLDASGNVYLLGETRSVNFPTSPGAFDTSLDGYSDAFVLDGYSDAFVVKFDLAPCVLDLNLNYADNTLHMEFYVGSSKPGVWKVWLSFFNKTIPIWSKPILTFGRPLFVPISVPGFPSLETIGVLTTLTTPENGIICSDWETVDTGPIITAVPGAEDIEQLFSE